MEEIRSQWVWLEYQCDHKFRISNDTLYHYHRDKKTGFCYPDFTFKIVSFKKKKLIVEKIPYRKEEEQADSVTDKPWYITHYRLKARDVKRISNGEKVKFKEGNNWGVVVVKFDTINLRKRRERRE